MNIINRIVEAIAISLLLLTFNACLFLLADWLDSFSDIDFGEVLLAVPWTMYVGNKLVKILWRSQR